jgi:hypothetical protein
MGLSAMKKFAKFLGYTLAIGVGLALIASILVLIAAQFHTEANNIVVSLGDTEIAIQGLFEQSIWTIFVAWLAVGAAFLVVGIAVIFALAVATLAVIFALGITAASLGGIALLLASPFIAVAIVTWLIVRGSSKSPPATA